MPAGGGPVNRGPPTLFTARVRDSDEMLEPIGGGERYFFQRWPWGGHDPWNPPPGKPSRLPPATLAGRTLAEAGGLFDAYRVVPVGVARRSAGKKGKRAPLEQVAGPLESVVLQPGDEILLQVWARAFVWGVSGEGDRKMGRRGRGACLTDKPTQLRRLLRGGPAPFPRWPSPGPLPGLTAPVPSPALQTGPGFWNSGPEMRVATTACTHVRFTGIINEFVYKMHIKVGAWGPAGACGGRPRSPSVKRRLTPCFPGPWLAFGGCRLLWRHGWSDINNQACAPTRA
jgi:hypothetical protein